jgi:glycosyltransferase involved in cell wall biosynthesis
MSLNPPKLLFVVNVDWFFISHRLPIALGARSAGYEVHVATGLTNCAHLFANYGLILHPIYLERGDTSLLGLFRTFFGILTVCLRVRPKVIHLVTIKPVLLGGIIARLLGLKRIVASVSGLGYIFIAKGSKASLRRLIVSSLYRLALFHDGIRVIFQNPDDRLSLCKLSSLPFSKTVLIPGSGVSLSSYSPSDLPPGIPVVLFAARLLSSKGIYEFVDAASQLTGARFVIAGQFDKDNRDCIDPAQLNQWVENGWVEYWGYSDAMANVLSQASMVVLPSYREGLPKVLIEAAACARPVITTDVPGCRDAIDPDVTGLLVPAQDSNALKVAIQHLLDNPELCKAMGRAGRALAERKFDVKQVVETHLDIYAELIAENP